MSGPNITQVQRLLKTFYDSPIDSQGLGEKDLGTLHVYLMGIPQNDLGELHWFCDRANQTTRDAAVFLLRLKSYNGKTVEEWEKKLNTCLFSCSACVQKFEDAKITSRKTFLAAFPDRILFPFFAQFELSESTVVFTRLEELGFLLQGQPTSQSLATLPAPTLYRLVSNWIIFSDPRTELLISAHPPSATPSSWPENPVPPGLLVFLLHQNDRVRRWALSHTARSSLLPEDAAGFYPQALALVAHSLKQLPPNLEDRNPPRLVYERLRSTASSFPFATGTNLWTGIHAAMRLIPPKWLKSTPEYALDMRSLVINHLSCENECFREIFDCFVLLLKRLGKGIWEGGDLQPHVVFDSIRNNSAYLKSMQVDAPLVSWFQEFLFTVDSDWMHREVLTRVVDFLLCGSHGEVAVEPPPSFVRLGLSILRAETQKRGRNDPGFVTGLLHSPAEQLVALAYGSKYAADAWRASRKEAQTLVLDTLNADVGHLKAAVANLHRSFRDKASTTFSPLIVNKSLWTHLQNGIRSPDPAIIADILAVAANVSHIYPLQPSIFEKEGASPACVRLVHDVNECLDLFRTALCTPVFRFAQSGDMNLGVAVVNSGQGCQSLIILLCSPLEDYRDAAESITGLAFDMDGRRESFTNLLKYQPDQAFQGILRNLHDFKSYANSAVEACKLASAFLSCFTDILVALCSPGGPLNNKTFLRTPNISGPSGRIVQVWKSMTASLCVVFARAVVWAGFFSSSEMVLWIRDALILARGMIEQWTIVEHAARGPAEEERPKGGRLSPTGQAIMDAFQSLLADASRWLRITDAELLYQSSCLIKTLLGTMLEYRVKLGSESLERLKRLLTVDPSKKSQTAEGTTPQPKTKLDPDTYAVLSELVHRFTPPEPPASPPQEIIEIFDDPQPVAGPSKPKPIPKLKAEPTPAQPAPAPRAYIQGKAKHLTKPVASGSSQAKLPFQASRKTTAPPPPKPAIPATLPPRPTRSEAVTIPKPSVSRSSSRSSTSSRAASDASSGSEDEDSDAEGGASRVSDLGRIDKKPRPPVQIKPPAPPRQIKQLGYGDIGVTTNRAGGRVGYSQQDRAARLKPNISGLHKMLLSWSYNDTGPLPPKEQLRLDRVPQRFNDYDHFFRIFENLLMAECWAQLQQSKDEKQESFSCKIESCHYVDSWVEIRLIIPGAVEKGWYLAETDVVLLEKGSEKILAKVASYKSAPQVEVTVRIASSAKTASLAQDVEWQLSKTFSLSTLHREYAALVSLRHNPICDTILRAKISVASAVRAEEVKDVMKLYKLNEPQATAILKVMSTDGFSLIQGPPGTGKTSTICGLVARFMAKRRKPPVPIQAGVSKTKTLEPKARILLCAPSNAAIDEIANRIKGGYMAPDGTKKPISVVRIGTEQAINPSTRDISLDTLVDEKLGATPALDTSELETTKLELEEVRQKINTVSIEIQKTLDTNPRKLALQSEIERLHSKRRQLRDRQNNLRDEKSSASRSLDTQRRNARAEILNDADVICTTLSGAGHESIESLEFDTIVIDEAAQAIEPSSLIPLKYDFVRCVLVGDPQQLPPTVISQEATRFGYNQSLFVRLQGSQPTAVHLLSIQYRMHPDISVLPSRLFYQKKLLDGPNMAEKTKRPWHDHPRFGTYKFFNVPRGVEEQSGRSVKNPAECEIVVSLFRNIRGQFSTMNFDGRVGIVSMYRAQIVELRRRFENAFGRDVAKKVDFNTVDGFQGQEKDIIILSCVRGGPGLESVGFLSDVRRMNVALTRAKASLFIVGNAPTLERSDQNWKQIVADARSRSVLVSPSYFTKRDGSPPPPPAMKRTASPPPITPPAKQARLEPQVSNPSLALYKPNEFKTGNMRNGASGSLPSGSASLGNPTNTGNTNGLQPRIASGTKRPADAEATKEGSTSRGPAPPPKKQRKKEVNIFMPKQKRS